MTSDMATGGEAVTATVREDGTGTVTLGGESIPISGQRPSDARAAAIRIIRDHARSLNQAIHVDTRDPNGQWTVTVFPDGRIEEPQPRRANKPPNTAPPTRQQSDSLGKDIRAILSNRGDDNNHDEKPGPTTTPPQPPSTPVMPPPATTNRTPGFSDVTQRLANRAQPAPAAQGLRGAVTHATRHRIRLSPGNKEQRERDAIESIARSFGSPKTIVVINPRGGSHKTTATLLLAATFGGTRGGYTLAWDNNETVGNLGWRAPDAQHQQRHNNTAVELLRDLDTFNDPTRARVGDLDHYVRSQGAAWFDILASTDDHVIDDDAGITGHDFRRLHKTLARFYRVLLVDTGNEMAKSNWRAAVDLADQLVITTAIREDTFTSAAWMVDGLRGLGYHDKVTHAVVIMGEHKPKGIDQGLAKEIKTHFEPLTRAIHRVPYEDSMTEGGALNPQLLTTRTRQAWLYASADIADGL